MLVSESEEVPVYPMPQEDAEYELPSEASAEDAGTGARESAIWHPSGGTEDRERRGVNHPLAEVAQGAIGQRNPGVNKEGEQQREDDAVDRVRELPMANCAAGDAVGTMMAPFTAWSVA